MCNIFTLPKCSLFWRNQFLPIDVKIYVTHMGSYQRKYQVIGLTENGANTQTFPFERDGNTIDMTVQNYFKNELNVSLR